MHGSIAIAETNSSDVMQFERQAISRAIRIRRRIICVQSHDRPARYLCEGKSAASLIRCQVPPTTSCPGIIEKWSAGFEGLDAAALAIALFKERVLFGSDPALYRGRAVSRPIFNALPRWRSPAVQSPTSGPKLIGPDLINLRPSRRSCRRGRNTLSVKITWVIAGKTGTGNRQPPCVVEAALSNASGPGIVQQ